MAHSWLQGLLVHSFTSEREGARGHLRAMAPVPGALNRGREPEVLECGAGGRLGSPERQRAGSPIPTTACFQLHPLPLGGSNSL